MTKQQTGDGIKDVTSHGGMTLTHIEDYWYMGIRSVLHFLFFFFTFSNIESTQEHKYYLSAFSYWHAFQF